MIEQLKFIASYDDVIQFCGNDVSLGERFQTIFGEAQSRVVSFDPIISAASNEEMFNSNIWTKKEKKDSKRGIGRFDEVKYTNLFIEKQKQHLEDPDNFEGMNRDGFDPYTYLMKYEEEILAVYSKTYEDFSNLQKAALHYVELGYEKPELNYVRYIATYDDLVIGAIAGKPEDKDMETWLNEIGKLHYESVGKSEILTGVRPLLPFFDATKYIATYAQCADMFKNDDGSLNEDAAALAYMTVGREAGLVRDGFTPYTFLANYPDLITEDIYVNEEISIVKVAKIWLERFKEGLSLDKFDPQDYKETMGLDDTIDSAKQFVEDKVAEYRKLLKKRSKKWYRFTHLCSTPKNPMEKLQ